MRIESAQYRDGSEIHPSPPLNVPHAATGGRGRKRIAFPAESA